MGRHRGDFFCNIISFCASIIETGDIRNKAQWRKVSY